ncbi:unnamed protein product, partial [Prorocentrum cordatum]
NPSVFGHGPLQRPPRGRRRPGARPRHRPLAALCGAGAARGCEAHGGGPPREGPQARRGQRLRVGEPHGGGHVPPHGPALPGDEARDTQEGLLLQPGLEEGRGQRPERPHHGRAPRLGHRDEHRGRAELRAGADLRLEHRPRHRQRGRAPGQV